MKSLRQILGSDKKRPPAKKTKEERDADRAWKELTKNVPASNASKSAGGSETPLTPFPG